MLNSGRNQYRNRSKLSMAPPPYLFLLPKSMANVSKLSMTPPPYLILAEISAQNHSKLSMAPPPYLFLHPNQWQTYTKTNVNLPANPKIQIFQKPNPAMSLKAPPPKKPQEKAAYTSMGRHPRDLPNQSERSRPGDLQRITQTINPRRPPEQNRNDQALETSPKTKKRKKTLGNPSENANFERQPRKPN